MHSQLVAPHGLRPQCSAAGRGDVLLRTRQVLEAEVDELLQVGLPQVAAQRLRHTTRQKESKRATTAAAKPSLAAQLTPLLGVMQRQLSHVCHCSPAPPTAPPACRPPARSRRRRSQSRAALPGMQQAWGKGQRVVIRVGRVAAAEPRGHGNRRERCETAAAATHRPSPAAPSV